MDVANESLCVFTADMTMYEKVCNISCLFAMIEIAALDSKRNLLGFPYTLEDPMNELVNDRKAIHRLGMDIARFVRAHDNGEPELDSEGEDIINRALVYLKATGTLPDCEP